MRRFIEEDVRTQSTLLPETLDDYVTEDNPARAIDALATIYRCSWAKGIAQEVESLLRVVAAPICIFAVHDLRLVRMQFQLARGKPPFQRLPLGALCCAGLPRNA